MIESISVNDRCIFSNLKHSCKSLKTLRWIFLILIEDGFIEPSEYDVEDYILHEFQKREIIFVRINFLDGSFLDFSVSSPFYKIEHCIFLKDNHIIPKPNIDLLYCHSLSGTKSFKMSLELNGVYLPSYQQALTQELLEFINNGTKNYKPFNDNTLISEDKVAVTINGNSVSFDLNLEMMGGGYNKTINFFMACHVLLSSNGTIKVLMLNESFDSGLDNVLSVLLTKKSEEMGINLIDAEW